MFDMFTTPQPTWVQGATGEMGIVPADGSHVVKDGYHAERLRAFRTTKFVMLASAPASGWSAGHTPSTRKPSRSSTEAPEPRSPTSCRRCSRTKERMPAVRGVAKEVPEVS